MHLVPQSHSSQPGPGTLSVLSRHPLRTDVAGIDGGAPPLVQVWQHMVWKYGLSQ